MKDASNLPKSKGAAGPTCRSSNNPWREGFQLLTLAPVPLVLSFDLMSPNPGWRSGLHPSALSTIQAAALASLGFFGLNTCSHWRLLFPTPPVFPQGDTNTAGVKLSLPPCVNVPQTVKKKSSMFNTLQ